MGTKLEPQDWTEVLAPPCEIAESIGALVPTGLPAIPADELEKLARAIAARPELWESLTLADTSRRRYRLAFENDQTDIWVLSWMAGQRTGFHDHDRSAVGLAMADGEVIERQLLLPSGATAVTLRPGDSRQGPAGYIHSVGHHVGEPAVSIHCFSPPLMVVGQYRVDEAGVLRREPEHGRRELIDYSVASIAPELT